MAAALDPNPRTVVKGVRFRSALVTEVRSVADRDGEDFSTTLRRLVRLGLDTERQQDERRDVGRGHGA
jgi:hypothetical protein